MTRISSILEADTAATMMWIMQKRVKALRYKGCRIRRVLEISVQETALQKQLIRSHTNADQILQHLDHFLHCLTS